MGLPARWRIQNRLSIALAGSRLGLMGRFIFLMTLRGAFIGSRMLGARLAGALSRLHARAPRHRRGLSTRRRPNLLKVRILMPGCRFPRELRRLWWRWAIGSITGRWVELLARVAMA